MVSPKKRKKNHSFKKVFENENKIDQKKSYRRRNYLSTDFRRVRVGGVGPIGGGVFVVDVVGVDPREADDTGRRTFIDE